MITLPNPFESALAPAMAADDGHWPATAVPADPVAVTFPNSAAGKTSPAVDAAVASNPPPAHDAAANQSSTATGGRQEAPAEATQNPATAGLLAREDYIPELFSSFVRRRCMDKVNPPLQQCRREFELDEAAFFDAILPPEPPPIFLRKPSQAFIRALFELAN